MTVAILQFGPGIFNPSGADDQAIANRPKTAQYDLAFGTHKY